MQDDISSNSTQFHDGKLTITYYTVSVLTESLLVLAVHYHYQPAHIVDEWYFCARLPTAHQ